jgi:hypothetical protein
MSGSLFDSVSDSNPPSVLRVVSVIACYEPPQLLPLFSFRKGSVFVSETNGPAKSRSMRQQYLKQRVINSTWITRK